MARIAIDLACPVHRSFRVEQVAGMFGLSLPAGACPGEPPLLRRQIECDAPEMGEDWSLGVIVGPSGSGKTTVARRLFGDAYCEPAPWAADRAVIDGFGERPIKSITAALIAVGLGSPPAWIKPYPVLSGGERFRCDLARALLSATAARPLVVFDEFTSVVDRNVAQVSSAAVARAIRRGALGCRFVAVTCHYDVVEWLAPDWVLDMATRALTRRRLRRPPIELQLVRCQRAAWRAFAPDHYLSGDLSAVAQCFLALWRGAAVAFCASVAMMGHARRRRISRLVTLPDYQGIGIGAALLRAVAELHRAEGQRVNITTSHPAIIAHCRRAAAWRAVGVRMHGGRHTAAERKHYRDSRGRAVVSFEFVG